MEQAVGTCANPIHALDFTHSRSRLHPPTGWDLGFAGMSIGEKAILVIDSELGYGARGAGGAIPGGATLYFEVELMGFAGAKELGTTR